MLNVITLILMLQLYSNYSNLRYELDTLKSNNKLLSDRLAELNKRLEVYEEINILIQTMIRNIMARIINQTLTTR
jgi:hypothetical protein